ncbi:hypothetical protein ENBRE01_1220 [Enteropsectra breve]|nr:hypothetical protein ENBRE01_1220 [Enteropsectra breve]
MEKYPSDILEMHGKTREYFPELENMLATLKRRKKLLVKLLLPLLLFFFTLVILKKKLQFFTPRDSVMKEGIMEYINREMDKILTLSTRPEQNAAFEKLEPEYGLVPIRMTLTTAVFKYDKTSPPLILKRIIYNPMSTLNEDLTYKTLKHENIVQMKKAGRTYRTLPDGTQQTIIWIFFEYLDKKISQRVVKGEKEVIRKIVSDSLQGLEYMHLKHVAHLDIKIGNIVGQTTKRGTVYKLIDLGYAQRMPSNTGKVTIPKKNYGTYPYKPPEIVYRNEHGLKSDIWSLGAVAWFLSLKYTPFYKENMEKDTARYKAFLGKANKAADEDRFFFRKDTSPELIDFVKTCMRVNPDERPNATELLQHPFITGKELADESPMDKRMEISSLNESETETSSE